MSCNVRIYLLRRLGRAHSHLTCNEIIKIINHLIIIKIILVFTREQFCLDALPYVTSD